MGMDYSVRSGDRDELVATLRQFAADRGERGESERAGEANHAADLLERGDDQAYYDRVVYAVGDSDRYTVISGSREEIAAQLAEWVDAALHDYRAGLVAEASRALAAVREQGAEIARVGHLMYLVRE